MSLGFGSCSHLNGHPGTFTVPILSCHSRARSCACMCACACARVFEHIMWMKKKIVKFYVFALKKVPFHDNVHISHSFPHCIRQCMFTNNGFRFFPAMFSKREFKSISQLLFFFLTTNVFIFNFCKICFIIYTAHFIAVNTGVAERSRLEQELVRSTSGSPSSGCEADWRGSVVGIAVPFHLHKTLDQAVQFAPLENIISVVIQSSFQRCRKVVLRLFNVLGI